MKNNNGFTLIELLFVVSIMAILSVISYPFYLDYLRGSYREMAQNDMLMIAFKLERVKTKQFSYNVAFTNNLLKSNIYQNYSPLNGEKRYDFSYKFEDDNYKIIATPTARQGVSTGKLYLSFNGNSYDKKWDINNDESYAETW